MDIEIYIDKIVLDGFEATNRTLLSSAIQEQLTTLITEQGLPNNIQEPAEICKLDGEPIHLANNHKPNLMVPEIANGIYQGIKSIS